MVLSGTVIFFIGLSLVLITLSWLYYESLQPETRCFDNICIENPSTFHAQCTPLTCVYNLDSPKGIQSQVHSGSWSFAGDCIYIEFGTCQSVRLFYENDWLRNDLNINGYDFVIFTKKI